MAFIFAGSSSISVYAASRAGQLATWLISIAFWLKLPRRPRPLFIKVQAAQAIKIYAAEHSRPLEERPQRALQLAQSICERSQAKVKAAPVSEPALVMPEAASETSRQDWEALCHQLEAEIKLRHDSSRTLKSYRPM